MTTLTKVATMGQSTHWTLDGDLNGHATTTLDDGQGRLCMWIGPFDAVNTAPKREVQRLAGRIIEELSWWAVLWGCEQIRIEGTDKRLRQWGRLLGEFVLENVNGHPVLIKELR